MVGRIASFAILDLETSNLLGFNFNRIGITECCIYGIAASNLQNENATALPPDTPRVTHKLTLMLNPMMMVQPEAVKVTGLDNFLLEHESRFDENAAHTLISFIRHLQQPACLVAHNGAQFDFRIVRGALAKLNMHLPPETLCVDSMLAFWDIDAQRKKESSLELDAVTLQLEQVAAELDTETDIVIVLDSDDEANDSTNGTKPVVKLSEVGDALSKNDSMDWRTVNETTPKRPTNGHNNHPTKLNGTGTATAKRRNSSEQECLPFAKSSRRELFPHETEQKRHWHRQAGVRMPKNVYKLSKLYENTFGCMPVDAHHAEADVGMLMQLMLHYGVDFRSYAEQFAIPFAEVKQCR